MCDFIYTLRQHVSLFRRKSYLKGWWVGLDNTSPLNDRTVRTADLAKTLRWAPFF